MKPLLTAVAVLLAISNFSLMQDARALKKENETLTALVHRQQNTGNTLLSSLTSCRDTVDTMTTKNQVAMISAMDDDPEALELRKARMNKKKKAQVKPVYVLNQSPLDRDASQVVPASQHN